MAPSATTLRARALRRHLSPPEARLWLYLKSLRPAGHHFRRQAPFQNYFLDFVCYAHRLVIEIDGAHHDTEQQQNHDHHRDETLRHEGFRTLRFQARDVLTNFEAVTTAIHQALQTPQ